MPCGTKYLLITNFKSIHGLSFLVQSGLFQPLSNVALSQAQVMQYPGQKDYSIIINLCFDSKHSLPIAFERLHWKVGSLYCNTSVVSLDLQHLLWFPKYPCIKILIETVHPYALYCMFRILICLPEYEKMWLNTQYLLPLALHVWL